MECNATISAELPLMHILNTNQLNVGVVENITNLIQVVARYGFQDLMSNAIFARVGFIGSGIDLERIKTDRDRVGDYLEVMGDIMVSMTFPIGMFSQFRMLQKSGFAISAFGGVLNHLNEHGIRYLIINNPIEYIKELQVGSQAEQDYTYWNGDTIKENLEYLLETSMANVYWRVEGRDNQPKIVLINTTNYIEAIGSLKEALEKDPTDIYGSIIKELENACLWTD
ncbi:hypothetical protein KDE12_02250 [Campylobacter sp. faydin G-105]|uniref:hypothetical protein n=1 Tax=Campylobacter anatolicus TaxID=2829105 RepID=UPI001B9A0A75|nr:hypothetical protein [Campylobacter anatolicus]MBR8461670.1 hypothetical protein [Campylobacter anatolicus]